jgi:hypothetical protein
MLGRAQRGQATIEWIGLILVVTLLVLAVLTLAGGRLPGVALAEALASRIICAVSLDRACEVESALAAQYGEQLAELVGEHAPEIRYEQGELELPVDFRECREVACSLGPPSGAVEHSDAGLPAVAFVHVVDCRPEAAAQSEDEGFDCSGERAENTYVQYWLYYPDSSTLEELPGDSGYHEDDWEQYAVRIGPGGTFARASSHHGYNYEQSPGNWGSDANIGPLNDVSEAVGARPHGGWGPETGSFYVSGGSHAGNVRDDGIERRRWTPAESLILIPIESLGDADRETDFAVTPPWLKDVYEDPEAEGT